MTKSFENTNIWKPEGISWSHPKSFPTILVLYWGPVCALQIYCRTNETDNRRCHSQVRFDLIFPYHSQVQIFVALSIMNVRVDQVLWVVTPVKATGIAMMMKGVLGKTVNLYKAVGQLYYMLHYVMVHSPREDSIVIWVWHRRCEMNTNCFTWEQPWIGWPWTWSRPYW